MGETHYLSITQEPEQRGHRQVSAGKGAAASSWHPRSDIRNCRAPCCAALITLVNRHALSARPRRARNLPSAPGRIAVARWSASSASAKLARAVTFVVLGLHAAGSMDVEARIEQRHRPRHHRTVETAATLVDLPAKLITACARRRARRPKSGRRRPGMARVVDGDRGRCPLALIRRLCRLRLCSPVVCAA